jgi:hypothetical protein
MAEFLAKLRYYPGDSLQEIREETLKNLGRRYGVKVSYEKIENREWKENLWMENTLDKRVEDISQEVITVHGESEEKFSDCIRAIYKKYRCPRTPYSLLGSNEAGQKIARGLMNLHGGW